MNEKTAINTIKEIKEIFDGLGIKFWLESGALLGAYREGRFIPWDIDIDLGTSDEHLPKMKIISKAFKNRGFEVYYSTYNSCMGLWKSGISIDVPFWRIDGDYAIAPLRYIENKFGKVLYYFDWVLLYSHYKNISNVREIKYRLPRYCLVKITDVLPERIKIYIEKHYSNYSSSFVYERFYDNIEIFYYQRLAVISPVFKGYGLINKTIEAMYYGCPVIGDPAAFNGLLNIKDGVNAFVADNTNDFIDKVSSIQLKTANFIVNNAFELLKKQLNVKNRENEIVKMINNIKHSTS